MQPTALEAFNLPIQSTNMREIATRSKVNSAKVIRKWFTAAEGDRLRLQLSDKTEATFWFDNGDANKVSKNEIIRFVASYVAPIKMSSSNQKKVLAENSVHCATNFVGEIIEAGSSDFIVDAGALLIYVDKEEGFGIGDFVTGQIPSEIRCHLVKEGQK